MWVNISQAAKLTGYKYGEIRRLISKGAFPFYHNGKKAFKFELEDLKIAMKAEMEATQAAAKEKWEEQQLGDKQQMIDLTSSFEWDMMIELCERDWPFLEGCSEEELDTLAELVDVAEDLLDLPAQMPPTKMPSGIYWEVINVVDSYHKNRRRNGDVI